VTTIGVGMQGHSGQALGASTAIQLFSRIPVSEDTRSIVWRLAMAGEYGDGRVTSGWLAAGIGRAEMLPAGSHAEQRYVGGMWLPVFHATMPLVVLELHERGVRLVGRRRVLRAMFPIWEARYEELSEVRAIGKFPLLATGVRFRVAEGENGWSIFWYLRRRRVLQALEERGLCVRADPLRLNVLNPGIPADR